MKYDEFLKLENQKKKPKRKPRHLESEVQKACVRYFRLKYPNYIVLSVPNGGSRNALEAANLKREGALAGVSDLIVIAERAVLFVEMKYGKNRQSEKQKQFQQAVERLGHTYVVCYGLQDFMLIIERWLKEKLGVYDTQI